MEKKRETARNSRILAEKLKKQIVYGCGERSCIGIFCKISDAEPFSDEIAQMLMEYGDYFTCCSIYMVHGRLLFAKRQEGRHCLKMSIHPNLSTGVLPRYEEEIREGMGVLRRAGEGMQDGEDCARVVLGYLHTELETMSNSSSVPASPFISSRRENPDRSDLNTKIAQIMHKKRDKTTSIMLQGVFYHEINKIKVFHSRTAAVRVVKLFNAVKESVKFEKKYFIRFLEGIQEMCKSSPIGEVLCMSRCNKMPGGASYNRETECGFFEEEEFPRADAFRRIEQRPRLEGSSSAAESKAQDRGTCCSDHAQRGERCDALCSQESICEDCHIRKEKNCQKNQNDTYPSEKIWEEAEKCQHCEGSLRESEFPKCGSLCLNSATLCVNELIDLIRSLIIVIDNTSVTNMREGTLLISILNTLKQLYRFSVESGIVHHSVFVNRRFSRLLNYKAEVRYHKEGEPSVMDYSFILDMGAKADLIQIENTDRMKTELQDSFFRSLFVGKIPPYLTFEVKRETLVEDSLRLLQTLEKDMVWKQLKIKFHGEDGIDSGGIKKEFFQMLSQKTLEEWDIFEERNGYLWIKGNSKQEIEKRLQEYYVLGRILGLAAYNGAVLCFYFPNVFYKKLLGHPALFDDLKQIDPALHNSLRMMGGMGEEEIAELGLEFPSGENEGAKVTLENVTRFIEAYSREVLEVVPSAAFEKIRSGLWSICGDTFIRSLLPCELSILIGGMECQNLEEIEKYTIYNGFRRDSAIVQHFWEVFREYDVKMQKKFLRFVTGSDRAPSGGLSRMAIVFMRNGGDTERLPSSQTCFNTLLIPEYVSKEKLKEKLSLAITHTEGFFLL